jgi:Spy/CpxP family protein refolding chaperone
MSSRVGTLALVVAAWCGAGATAGCAGSSADSAPPATAAGARADDEAAAGLVEHRRHHHGGVTLLIAMSLDAPRVSPRQRAAVRKIQAELYAPMRAVRIAEQHLLVTLADGLAAGDLDAATVDASVARVSAAMAAVHAASADALNELHAVLTPRQRAALIDRAEARWAEWQKANTPETGPARPNAAHVAMLELDLGLTPDQMDLIRATVGERARSWSRRDPRVNAAHLRAFGDAFRHGGFDARARATADGANEHLVTWGAARMAHFVEAVSPMLAPDQRDKLARRLRDHASHSPSAVDNP